MEHNHKCHRKRLPSVLSSSLLILLAVIISSCATVGTSDRKQVSKSNELSPKTFLENIGAALTDHTTLIPALGSLAIIGLGVDRDISNWSSGSTPIYGSRKNAVFASNNLRDILRYEMLLTSILRLRQKDYSNQQRLQVIGTYVLSKQLAQNSTSILKKTTKRLRPDGSDTRSFPSGHTSSAFTNAFLANQNLRTLSIHPHLKNSLQAFNIILASGVAYARVEGRKHYLSDVLMSVALSNLFCSLLANYSPAYWPTGNFDMIVDVSNRSPGVRFTYNF